MNEDVVKKLEDWVGEFDFLFQEGVVFSLDEAHKIKELAHDILSIVNDSFFRKE